MSQSSKYSDQTVLNNIIRWLSPLEPDVRKRIIRTVLTYFDENSTPSTMPLQRELAAFIQCAREGVQPKVSGREATMALEAALEITRLIEEANPRKA